MKATEDPKARAVGNGCGLGCGVMLVFALIAGGGSVASAKNGGGWIFGVAAILGLITALAWYYYEYSVRKRLEVVIDKGDSETILYEMYATYCGGHKATSEKANVKLILTNERLIANAIGYPIFYASIPLSAIVDYGVDTKERITATRVFLVGLLAIGLKKEDKYFWIEYTDVKGIKHTPVFHSDYQTKLSQLQGMLYSAIVSQSEKDK